jgi:hypothetical protein
MSSPENVATLMNHDAATLVKTKARQRSRGPIFKTKSVKNRIADNSEKRTANDSEGPRARQPVVTTYLRTPVNHETTNYQPLQAGTQFDSTIVQT